MCASKLKPSYTSSVKGSQEGALGNPTDVRRGRRSERRSGGKSLKTFLPLPPHPTRYSSSSSSAQSLIDKHWDHSASKPASTLQLARKSVLELMQDFVIKSLFNLISSYTW